MLKDYIKTSWGQLLRHSLDVALDPKVSGGMRTFLYIAADENPAKVNKMIAERRKVTESQTAIEVSVLPEDMVVTQDHGILYLPYDYVVPGGRFNEMYAWDSYWIILGLLQDGRTDIARGIIENFLYEIRHYGGKTLNANRTYYLSRSQPPMTASMAWAVMPNLKDEEQNDFLENVVDTLALEYIGFWKNSRYDAENGLFHYGNIQQGELGMCPEVAFGERDEKGLSHYDKIVAYLRDLIPGDAARQRFFDETSGCLMPEAIAGDRAMRESGFDASMHMGYYGLETIDFRPVCLNTLLYEQCQILEKMCMKLGQKDRATYFHDEAQALKVSIQKYMWDEETGLFRNFNRYQNQLSPFNYLTSVYPLWAGIATSQQAARFHKNLSFFETPFGIRSTDQQTGCQWDAPFMWAPLVYFTVMGLDRYGYYEDARRVAQKFIDTVTRVYAVTGANFEKYNAETGDCRTEGIIDVGYSENVVGFGWTNGATIVLQNWLDADNIKEPAVG